MAGIQIIGTGSALPEKRVVNDDFTKFVETSDEWISTRTGIRARRIATGDESTWKLGAEAARRALEQAGITAGELDMVIVSTVSGDTFTPGLSCLVGQAIGTQGAFCFDINAACTGFVYALDVARQYLSTGEARHILVVSSERLTKITNFEDRATCVLFGDGAGACVVTASDRPYACYRRTDTTGATSIYAVSPSMPNPFVDGSLVLGAGLDGAEGYMHMNGKDVYKFAVQAIPEALQGAAKQYGIDVGQISAIVPHQANIRIIQTAAKTLGLPMERFHMNIDRYGNTSSATIPICLDEMARDGRLTPGCIVGIVGFGAGLTYGASVFEW